MPYDTHVHAVPQPGTGHEGRHDAVISHSTEMLSGLVDAAGVGRTVLVQPSFLGADNWSRSWQHGFRP